MTSRLPLSHGKQSRVRTQVRERGCSWSGIRAIAQSDPPRTLHTASHHGKHGKCEPSPVLPGGRRSHLQGGQRPRGRVLLRVPTCPGRPGAPCSHGSPQPGAPVRTTTAAPSLPARLWALVGPAVRPHQTAGGRGPEDTRWRGLCAVMTVLLQSKCCPRRVPGRRSRAGFLKHDIVLLILSVDLYLETTEA